jgi:hypothetical protein
MIRNLWPLLIGFTIWAVAFLAIYSIQALGCAWSWDPWWHRAVLVAAGLATILCLAATLAMQLRWIGSKASTIERAGTILTATALPIALVTFLPVGFLALCT